ncbi:MAG: ABC transporter ATP-binding protein [Myxococcota bacterium]
MTRIAIRTEGLTRRFGDRTAVDGLDLEVHEGEVLGFLGPNGAGKTTTIRMLCCLIAPTAGRAEVAGHAVPGPAGGPGADGGSGADAIRRSVGLLTETPGLYDRLSVHRNLEIFASLYGVRDVRGQVRRWLERFGLWDRRDAQAGTLSKGMRQKLAICRALVHDPPIVFLDEPTSALDPEASGRVRALVAELRRDGRTVFLTTHNLDDADRLCDRVAVFSTRLRVLDSVQNLRHTLFGRQVAVRVVGPAAFRAVVAGVDGVSEVTLDGDRLLARVVDPPAATPRIVRALVGAGADVLAVDEVHHSLEQVYLALVGAG